jgi:hypothetical protein
MLILRPIAIMAISLVAVVAAHAQDFRWSIGGALRQGRHWHRAEALQDGRILVIGGIVGSNRYVDGAALNGNSIADCELYDPVSGTTVDAAVMNVPRSEFPSVVTPEGKVIVFGGLTGESERGPCTSSIEEYDPALDRWEIVGSLSVDRRRHSAVMLDERRVLIVGGCPSGRVAVSLCEIYDIVDRTTRTTDPLPQRLKEGALHIVDGVPMYVGGREGGPNSQRQTAPYVFDVVTETWSAVTGSDMPAISTATTLDDGSLVVCGGNIQEQPATFSRAVYHINGGVSNNVMTMDQERTLHAMVGMGGRSVLVTGGIDNAMRPMPSTLLIDVDANQLLIKSDLVIPRAYHSLLRVEHPMDGTTFYAISGMQGDQTLTNTIEKLSIGSEDGLINHVSSVQSDDGTAMMAYPNPCTNELTVRAEEGSDIRIVDVQGRVVRRHLATDAMQSTLDVGDIAPGAYQVVVERGGRRTSTPVIKR